MSGFIGIDLGTTNTVVATYDGSATTVVKEYGQSDSTPSAVLVLPDKTVRVGHIAIKDSARMPNDLYTRFKRLLGSNAKFTFPSANVVHTPVWASAELLREVFSWVDPDVANATDRVVVVTVPAAFKYQQNLATKEAASRAGLGSVELLAEPIAAALCIAKNSTGDKTVLVYDMGGGTFDVSIVRITDGKPSILAQGGISHLGGSDWDNEILNSCVRPWLAARQIDDADINNDIVHGILTRAIEVEKKEIARKKAANPDSHPAGKIRVFKGEHPLRLPDGGEFDIDVPVSFSDFDDVAAVSLKTSLGACRDVLAEVNLLPGDIDGIAFIGGPALWPTVKSQVSNALGIPELKGVNPLTSVAEGAAIYAHSKRASDVRRVASIIHSTIEFPIDVTYQSVTAERRPKVQVTLDVTKFDQVEFSIEGAGFTTGRLNLQFTRDVSIELLSEGESTFTVTVYPPGNMPSVSQSFTIMKIIGIGTVPANDTTFIRALSPDGSEYEAIKIVKRGQSLPTSGSFRVRLTKDIKNEDDYAEFKVFQGEITDEINDNTYVGALLLTGKQLAGKQLSRGAELVCKYELGHGLDLTMDLVIPDIDHTVKNLYFDLHDGFDPALGWVDLIAEAKSLRKRILEFLRTQRQDSRLADQLPILVGAIRVLEESNIDDEITKAHSDIQTVRNVFFLSRADNVPAELKLELENKKQFFETGHGGKVKEALKPSEIVDIEKWFASGYAAAEVGIVDEVAKYLQMLDRLKWKVLWRCDWWVEIWLTKYSSTSSIPQLAEEAKKGIEALNHGEFATASKQLEKCIDLKRAHDKSATVSPTLQDDIQISS